MADPPSLSDLHKNPIYNEAELEEMAPRSQDSGFSLSTRLRSKFRCSGAVVKSLLLKIIPILNWLPRYPFREWLLGDIISGLSVGIIQLPQGLAYALLAGVPPVFGLYSSFYPVLIYTIFGTSRHISPGTFAVISVMVGSVTESLAPSENFLMPGNDSMIDTVARDAARVQVASALTLLVGIFQTFITLCSKIPQTNVASLIIGILSIAVLLIVKFLNEKYMSVIRIPIPIELFTLIVATGISYGVNLHKLYGVAIVGNIPTGLSAPIVPDTQLFASVVGNAFAIAIVVYAFTISVVKMFSVKHAYNVDSNQELLALGLSNSFGSFFQCFTIGTAMSRSLVQESTGGNSQVAGGVSAVVILIIILKAGELFESLPKAILASVVVVNLKGIFKQFQDIPILWRSNKIDLMVWVVTFIATILLNLDLGLAVSVAFSLLMVIFRTQWPHYSLLGQVSSTDIYRDVSRYKQAHEVPGIRIFRSSCTLYFANAELYANAVKKMCGVDVDKLIEMKNKEAKKKKQLHEKAEKEAKKAIKEKKDFEDTNDKIHELQDICHPSPEAKGLDTEQVVVYEESDDSTVNCAGSNECPFHSLILDLSTVSFVDTVSIKTLKNIFRDFKEIDVSIYLVGSQENVLEQLERGNFFSKTITKHQLFSSIHDAVAYISKLHNKESEKEDERSTKI
ncbi:solute carrier family 26 member 6-like isoform X2 [Engystomops pustulosus]|uniref:solute carrier family 26 member 6-like isoform X2 n=1 Tax=Engystomops pustulosus TaxID=76066 RepID=UPI003AFAD29A